MRNKSRACARHAAAVSYSPSAPTAAPLDRCIAHVEPGGVLAQRRDHESVGAQASCDRRVIAHTGQTQYPIAPVTCLAEIVAQEPEHSETRRNSRGMVGAPRAV